MNEERLNLRVVITGSVYGHPTQPGEVAPCGKDTFTYTHCGITGAAKPWVGLSKALKKWCNTQILYNYGKGSEMKDQRSFYNPEFRIECKEKIFIGGIGSYLGESEADMLEEHVGCLLDPTRGGFFMVRSCLENHAVGQ